MQIYNSKIYKQILLMTFKIIERFFAIIALVKCFAGCRAKFTDTVRMIRITTGTFNRFMWRK